MTKRNYGIFSGGCYCALTNSVNPRDYWFKMKIRVKEEDGFEPSTICRQLKLLAEDGKMRETDCADTEGIFV